MRAAVGRDREPKRTSSGFFSRSLALPPAAAPPEIWPPSWESLSRAADASCQRGGKFRLSRGRDNNIPPIVKYVYVGGRGGDVEQQRERDVNEKETFGDDLVEDVLDSNVVEAVYKAKHQSHSLKRMDAKLPRAAAHGLFRRNSGTRSTSRLALPWRWPR